VSRPAWLGPLAAGVLLAACAGGPFGRPAAERAPTATEAAGLLKRAEDELLAARYPSAIGLYDEFLRAHPNDPAASRARAVRTVLERLAAAQGEVDRLRREGQAREAEAERLRREGTTRLAEAERLRREAETRLAELERLRREGDAYRSEIERLKADLERLRRIDLRETPAAR
jgi:hypothetical protein